jgi:hypothetical protein
MNEEKTSRYRSAITHPESSTPSTIKTWAIDAKAIEKINVHALNVQAENQWWHRILECQRHRSTQYTDT